LQWSGAADLTFTIVWTRYRDANAMSASFDLRSFLKNAGAGARMQVNALANIRPEERWQTRSLAIRGAISSLLHIRW
jgi:hypothetical protein